MISAVFLFTFYIKKVFIFAVFGFSRFRTLYSLFSFQFLFVCNFYPPSPRFLLPLSFVEVSIILGLSRSFSSLFVFEQLVLPMLFFLKKKRKRKKREQKKLFPASTVGGRSQTWSTKTLKIHRFLIRCQLQRSQPLIRFHQPKRPGPSKEQQKKMVNIILTSTKSLRTRSTEMSSSLLKKL